MTSLPFVTVARLAINRPTHVSGELVLDKQYEGPRWENVILSALRIGDLAIIVVATLAAHIFRTSRETATPNVEADFHLSYLFVSIVLVVAWYISLGIARSRDRRVIGIGIQEFQAVFHGTWQVFAAVAIVAYLLKAEIARSYVLVAAPFGLILLLAYRYMLRIQLHRLRRSGRALRRVLVVGNLHKSGKVISDLQADPRAGYKIVGLCVPPAEAEVGSSHYGVKVRGDLDSIVKIARDLKADLVAVTGADSITSQVVRELGWALEGSGTHLVLVPALTDVAGPRMITSPVRGTTLVQIEAARFTGLKHVAKALVDWLAAFVITTLISPVLLVIAILVKVTSRGPVLYRQERIGLDGKPFKMLKFRSMVPDAHLRLAEVLEAEGVSEVGMFYKPKNDPRVTPVGRVLRRYSLDELPQLFNVLRGEMSLVGPRPQIDKEVELYDHVASRRLLVKPGLTGLWQVSGRSDLSPEEGIRMDVYYVENWTVFGDILILLRTAKAMIAGEGAY